MDYFLRSARLGFRCWTPGDLDLAMGLWGDPLVTGLIDARGRLDPGQVADRLNTELETRTAYGVQYWPFFLLGTDEHIGCCGLRPYGSAVRVFEMGVHVRSNHWGAGHAYEACRAVIDYAFTTLGIPSLFAGHNPRNDGSRRLLAKLGFRHTHDELYPPTGLLHPSYILEAGSIPR